MSRLLLTISIAAFLLTAVLGTGAAFLFRGSTAAAQSSSSERVVTTKRMPYPSFEIDVLVNGRPLTEYYARGKTYVEALQGAEYEVRLRNASADRVAVALSVDGLNTIDAQHTSAWNASKWVIEPYQTITIGGWQMSSERARRFYFTNERDSYAAKLGQTANLGVISAVFFRERRSVISVTPRPIYRDDSRKEPLERDESSPSNKSRGESSRSEAPRKDPSRADAQASRDGRSMAIVPDDDYAATGIGRSVRNDVRWVNMDLESRPAGEVTLRYEYYSALLRLGVIPRETRDRDPLRRREDSRGFSPEP
ncbi:MAG TPA: hypothetical protein VGW58_09710 [Pyrinomonadaceae bacterium]|nr:hypothetical protein [Pyrinomonadaceae bacterium]